MDLTGNHYCEVLKFKFKQAQKEIQEKRRGEKTLKFINDANFQFLLKYEYYLNNR